MVSQPLDLQSAPDPKLVDQVFEVMGALIAASARIAVERGEDAALDHARELLDRLLHHAHVLKCGPRSWRSKEKTALRPKATES